MPVQPLPKELRNSSRDAILNFLPPKFQGYPTAYLLGLWDAVRTPQGIPEGTPVEEISAMSDILREYQIAPVFWDD